MLPPDPLDAPLPPEKLKGSSALRYARRVVIAVVGFTVLLVGAVFLVTPGPGVPTMVGGLAILAVEFSWARRWLAAVKSSSEVARIEFTAPRTRSLLRRTWLLLRGLVAALWWRSTAIFRPKCQWPPKPHLTLRERADALRRRFRPPGVRNRARRFRLACGRLWDRVHGIGTDIIARARKIISPPPPGDGTDAG